MKTRVWIGESQVKIVVGSKSAVMRRSLSMLRRPAAAALLALALAAASAVGQTEETVKAAVELKKLSLDELLNVEVTSVSRRPEKILETPSAIQVITQEDIHRSGATSIPEALRLAPNLQVAQVDSRQWAISARGFNNGLANKLLVMIDGRTIYTPLYAGVFWDAQHVLLEDIDRIEVVSGPGGTLWGANAVNGVINILTKSARDTQGALVTAGGGSLLKDFGAIRYGGGNGSNLFFRVYGQHFDRNSTVLRNGRDGVNAWDITQGGFRADWLPSDTDTVTLQGDVYGGSIKQRARVPFTTTAIKDETTIDGQNLLGRWTRRYSEESDLSVQIYFDRTWRSIPNTSLNTNFPNPFAEDLKTYDLDFQHRFPLGERQSVIWGAGYRLMQDEVRNSPTLAFLPGHKNLQLFSGFVQDEITLLPERLKFTLGTKLEHNDFSGLEVQPSARLAWTPDERQTIWSAVSRNVRSPSRIDADLFATNNLTSPPTQILPNSDFDSEKLVALELGYRVRPVQKVAISLAGYYNFYDDLRSVDLLGTNHFRLANHFKGETWGIELSANYQATEWWRLRGGYDYLHKHLWPTSKIASPSAREGNDPQQQFLLQSIMDLPADFEFDVTARYVDTLRNPAVPSYLTFDARFAWHFKQFELAVVGQNLWDDQHPEFGARATRQEIPRSVYGKVTWHF